MKQSSAPGGSVTDGEWVDHVGICLPAELFGASEEEKRAAIAAGNFGTARLRFRVVTKDQIDAEKRAAADEEEPDDGQREERNATE